MDEDTFIKVRESLAKPAKRLMARAEKAKTDIKNRKGCLTALLICLAIPVFPFAAALVVFFLPLFVIYAVIKSITGSGGRGRLKEFKAPLIKRFLRALPFFAVIVAAITAVDAYAENDTVQYAIAFAAIAVNVLMNFNTVRMQNDYAMRDIPVFTQKRGGDM